MCVGEPYHGARKCEEGGTRNVEHAPKLCMYNVFVNAVHERHGTIGSLGSKVQISAGA